MALMQAAQRTSVLGSKDVDVFIAPSEFLRQQYVIAGFPADRIRVKPNFSDVELPERHANQKQTRGYALFVGRLSAEKGVRTLLAAWSRLPYIPLVLIGDGPEGSELRIAARNLPNVTFVGAIAHPNVLEYLRQAAFLIVPSECHESFSMVTLEAFANGVPVIASALGALPELVADGQNGLLFRPKHADDLARQAAHLWSHPALTLSLGRAARGQYERRFTSEQNYPQLLGIYELAVDLHRVRSKRTSASALDLRPAPPGEAAHSYSTHAR